MQPPHGSIFPVQTVAVSAGDVGVVLALAAALVMMQFKRQQKHRDGGLQGEQDEGQQRELG